MRSSIAAAGLISLLGLAACSAQPQTASTPMAPASPGSASAMPQTSNSLPRNDVVNAPRAPSTGTVTTVPARGY